MCNCRFRLASQTNLEALKLSETAALGMELENLLSGFNSLIDRS